MFPRLILFLALAGLNLILPFELSAEECWTATLRIKVSERSSLQTEDKVWRHQSQNKREAQGQVTFLTGAGKTSIIHQELGGTSEGGFVRENSCVRHEGRETGILTAGVMSQTKRHTAFWRLTMEGRSLAKPRKGCMQEPIPPIHGTEEQEDPRFYDIVHPNLGKLVALCRKVRAFPTLGECRTTSEELSGSLEEKGGLNPEASPGKGGGPWVEATVRYEWTAKKVPCGCKASITAVKGEVTLNGLPVKANTEFNLSGAVVETVGRSKVIIETPDGLLLHIGPKTKMDLSGLCREIKEEKGKPFNIKVFNGSFYLILQRLFPGPIRVEHTGWIGVRGGLERMEKILWASSDLLGSLLAKEGMAAQDDPASLDLKPTEDSLKKASVALYYEFNPEQSYLLIEVMKGKVKIRETSGQERRLQGGERFYKKWTPQAKLLEKTSVKVLIGG